MKILILADPIDNQQAGIHVYTHEVIQNLLKIDKKNQYVFIHSEDNPFFKDLDHHIIPKKKIPGHGTFRKFIQIPNLIRKLKPDLVWEPCHIGPFNLAKNIKRVVTIHDLTPILFPKLHIKRSALIHKLLLKKVIQNAKLILTPSQSTKKDIENYHPTLAKITVTPLGINHQEATIKNSTPYLLYLGTIEPRKNLKTLIQAFNELQLPHHELILAGAIGWKADKIIKLASQNPKVKILGHVSEKEKHILYKNADAFIYPSLYEGFGLPILEAMNHGTPVICSNNSSLGELFKGKAILIPPTNKEKLKQAISDLLNNKQLQEKLSHKGKQFSKNFSWEKTAQATLNAFENIYAKTDEE